MLKKYFNKYKFFKMAKFTSAYYNLSTKNFNKSSLFVGISGLGFIFLI